MNKGDFQNIMNMAISIELEAFEFYRFVADVINDLEMKKLFREFAEEERAHADILTKIKEQDIENFSFCGGEGFTISNVCVGPDYKISERVGLPKLSMDMKPLEALALAMKKEEETINVYSNIAAGINDPDKKRIFNELAKMELVHKEKIEDLYTNAAFPEIW